MNLRINNIQAKYYTYIILLQMRFTRIIAILFLINYLNISLIQFTMLQSIFSMSQFIMEVPSGLLSDYVGNKVINVIGILLSALAQLIVLTLLFKTNLSYITLILAYVIEGIARAFISGSDEALFYKNFRENNLDNEYDKIIGKGRLVSAIAVGMATFLGGVMYSIDPKIPYVGQAIFSILAAVVILSVKEINDHKKTFLEEDKCIGFGKYNKMISDFLAVCKNFEVAFMVLFICFIFAIINTIFGIMPKYVDQLGFSSSESGILFMLLSFTGGIVAVKSHCLSKLSFEKLTIIPCVMMIIGLIFSVSSNNKLLIFIGLTLFYTIIDVLEPMAMKAFNSYVGDNIRATFLSMVAFITTANTMVLYPMSGYIVSNIGMKLLLIYTVIITLLFLSIQLLLYRSFKSKSEWDRHDAF